MRRGTRTTIVLTASLLAIAGLLSACAAAPGKASPAPSKSTVAPTMRLTTPADGSTVPAGDLSVAVETTGLKFVMPSNTLVAGEGHVHFTLDDQPEQMSTEPGYVFKDVAPGVHTLKAELVQNDTSSFDPPILQVITFTAE